MKNGSRTIRRTVDVLRAVSKLQGSGAVLSRIAREADLPVSTTHRLIASLVEAGLLHQEISSKTYFLSIEIYYLGTTAQQFNVKDRLRLAMEGICQKTEDIVYLMVRSGNEALCLDLVVGKFPIRAETLDIGGRRPLGIGTASLALLSFLPDYRVETIITANQGLYPKYNNISPDKIRALIKAARELGFVLSEGVFFEGITAMGFPIYDNKAGLIAAISVAAISKRLRGERLKEVAEIIKTEIEKSSFTLWPKDNT